MNLSIDPFICLCKANQFSHPVRWFVMGEMQTRWGP